MEKSTIESKVFAIFKDIFDIEGIELSLDSQPKDIEDWDSIGHIRLMLAMEEEFKIQILAEKAADERTTTQMTAVAAKTPAGRPDLQAHRKCIELARRADHMLRRQLPESRPLLEQSNRCRSDPRYSLHKKLPVLFRTQSPTRPAGCDRAGTYRRDGAKNELEISRNDKRHPR